MDPNNQDGSTLKSPKIMYAVPGIKCDDPLSVTLSEHEPAAQAPTIPVPTTPRAENYRTLNQCSEWTPNEASQYILREATLGALETGAAGAVAGMLGTPGGALALGTVGAVAGGALAAVGAERRVNIGNPVEFGGSCRVRPGYYGNTP